MLTFKGKMYWTLPAIIVLFPVMLGSNPYLIEDVLGFFLTKFPSLKQWGTDSPLDRLLILSAFGLIIFMISTLARFQEFKINIESIGLCRRQINLFRYFSYMTTGYVISFMASLYTSLYFHNPDVIKFLVSIINAIFISITFFLGFSVIKAYVLEEILDHYSLDRTLQNLVVTIPGFSKVKVDRDDS